MDTQRPWQARQGDLLVEQKSGGIPKTAKKVTNPIVAYGEVTGHSHAIKDYTSLENVDLFVDENGDFWVHIEDDQAVTLEHDTHGPVELQGPGEFCISRQREYDKAAQDEERRVLD